MDGTPESPVGGPLGRVIGTGEGAFGGGRDCASLGYPLGTAEGASLNKALGNALATSGGASLGKEDRKALGKPLRKLDSMSLG